MKFRRIPAFLVVSASIAVMATGCTEKADETKTEKAAKTQKAEKSAPAPEAARPEPKKEVKPPEPVWPEKLPDNWMVINDYEKEVDLSDPDENASNDKTKKKKRKKKGWKMGPANLLGGEWGKVGFNGGLCKLKQVKDGDNTVLQISYNMPTKMSECGTYEYLKPFIQKKVGRKRIPNYPQYFDLRPFDKITAMVKSGDDKEHNLKIHLTELDSYGSQLQGYVSPTKMIVATEEWKRVEFSLDKTLHEFFDRRHAQATGIRIRFQEQNDRNDSGVVLFDNLTLIKKTGK